MAFLEYIAITGAAGALWPIIKDNIKEAGTDFIKDKFKDTLKSIIPSERRDAETWQKAADEVLAKSLSKFVERAEVALLTQM